jgi:hypothetical protein
VIFLRRAAQSKYLNTHLKIGWLRLFEPFVICVLFSGCMKKTEPKPAFEPVNLHPCGVAYTLKKKWVWDSTTISKEGRPYYTFTNYGLTTYSAGSANQLVETVCTFTMDLLNYSQDKFGCLTEFQTYGDNEFASGKLFMVYRQSDTIRTKNTDVRWLVALRQDESEYLNIRFDENPRHEGTSVAGYLCFVGTVYKIETLTEEKLTIYGDNYPKPDGPEKYRICFHSSN